jgi:hypothetical protein
MNRSKRDNICGWLQAADGRRQLAGPVRWRSLCADRRGAAQSRITTGLLTFSPLWTRVIV